LQLLRLARYGYLLHPQPLSGGNPFQLSDLPSYISSGTFSVSAEAPALVPSDWTSFGLVPGKATRLRIVLPKPSTLEVVVRDASSGEPVPAALAISVTELRARGLNATEALDRGGPGTGHGDAVGAMTLADIRPGVHLVEVHAPGYQTLRLEKVTVGSGAS